MADPPRPANTAETTIAYDGDALRSGQMDVRDLAPALLGLGQVVQAANWRLNGDTVEVQVYVRADLRPGSFVFDIAVAQFLADAQTFLATNRDLIKDAQELLKLLGLVGGLGMGLLRYLKTLGNRKPDRIEPINDQASRVTIGNIHVEVRNEVIVLAGDEAVRSGLAQVLQPLSKPGIKTFEVREGKGESPSLVIADDEVPAITASPEETEYEEPALHEDTHVEVFEILKPALVPGRRWMLADRLRPFGVVMEDKAFQRRVERREITFGHGDLIKVRLRTRVTRDDDGKLHTTLKVVQVIDVYPAAKAQRNLFEPPKPPRSE